MADSGEFEIFSSALYQKDFEVLAFSVVFAKNGNHSTYAFSQLEAAHETVLRHSLNF